MRTSPDFVPTSKGVGLAAAVYRMMAAARDPRKDRTVMTTQDVDE